ncbi:MAG: response regulator [Reyranella sp.]|uniref:response regulator n=1 Tax=Reyranella sp. TaxID=1929291 RepID=UPI0027301F1E|nr:response regulator [Reyranella sp.]MDP1960838.1 response regulator [Reyranella sp.]MDP2376643.1 response regulator [Reyranella sp.]
MDYSDRGVLQQLFVDSLPDCALVLLDVDGKILTWNAGAQAMHGRPESEMIGRHFSCLYIQADIDAAKPLMSLAGAMAQGRHEETRQRRHKDGTELEVQDVLIPLYDPQKKLVAFGNLTREVGRSTRAVPVAPAVPALDSAPVAQELPFVPTKPRTKVLLVDDDEAVRAAAVDLLTSLGYEVIVASSGPEALELLARFADVDVLFTDVVMPGGMDGGEVAKQARELRPGVKVLFASGYFEGALVREGNIAANTHFLVKPYRKRDLAKMMDEVLGLKASAA